MSMKHYEALRQRHPRFLCRRPVWRRTDEALEIQLDFEIPDLAQFRPGLSIPLPQDDALRRRALTLPDAWIERMVWTIALVELISYWKACCPPVVEVEGLALDDWEKAWWLELYRHGLGEFFYRQGIDPDAGSAPMMRIVGLGADASSLQSPKPDPAPAQPPRWLIPVGGGKDSVVSLARLAPRDSEDADLRLAMAINATPAALATMDVAGLDETRRVLVRRDFDRGLIELNARGYLNGHTPFSALVAAVAQLVAVLHGAGPIVLSNEGSASDSSVTALEVNHQWSKSLAFESAFRDLQARRMPYGADYFSLLRPFSELAIAREFARYPAYHDVFVSCNLGGRENRWCGHCGKCLFIAIMLAPFLGMARVDALLGRALLADPALAEAFDGLTGALPTKPWECVGTRAEVQRALVLACRRMGWRRGAEGVPALIARWLGQVAEGRFGGVALDDAGAAYWDGSLPDPLQQFDESLHIPALFRARIATMLAEGADAFAIEEEPDHVQ